MVYTIVVHMQAKPVSFINSRHGAKSPIRQPGLTRMQDSVEKLKAKLIEAAGVYRQDKEVSASPCILIGSVG